MSAAGKVCTGFSFPFVAKYENKKYTGGMELARGVSVSIEPDSGEAKEFHANNRLAEESGGKFNKGTLKLVVDGLHQTAEKAIYGLPEPVAVTYGGSKTVKMLKYGDNAKPPYMGFGCIARYESDGVTTYAPVIVTKVKFQVATTEAKTQEGNQPDYQTQELSAAIYRDDSATHDWKMVGEDKATEEEALEIIKGILNVAGVPGA